MDSLRSGKPLIRPQVPRRLAEPAGTGPGSRSHVPHAGDGVVFGAVQVHADLACATAVPERQRLMFLMKHQQGMTCEEIADTMGTSVGTVKKTLFRVVDRLRQHFAIPVVKGKHYA